LDPDTACVEIGRNGASGRTAANVSVEILIMTIAEQIYAEVRTLPDELARAVLDFVGFIEARYALKSASARDLQGIHQAIASASKLFEEECRNAQPAQRRPRTPGSAVGKLKVLVEDDEHLKDFQDYMP